MCADPEAEAFARRTDRALPEETVSVVELQYSPVAAPAGMVPVTADAVEGPIISVATSGPSPGCESTVLMHRFCAVPGFFTIKATPGSLAGWTNNVPVTGRYEVLDAATCRTTLPSQVAI